MHPLTTGPWNVLTDVPNPPFNVSGWNAKTQVPCILFWHPKLDLTVMLKCKIHFDRFDGWMMDGCRIRHLSKPSGTDADSFAFQVAYIKPSWVSAWCQMVNLVHQIEMWRVLTKRHHPKSWAWEQADNICASLIYESNHSLYYYQVAVAVLLRKNQMRSYVFLYISSMFDKGPLSAFFGDTKKFVEFFFLFFWLIYSIH